MRSWTDPKILTAELDLHDAHRVVDAAQTRLGYLVENRRRQQRDEQQIRNQGGTPYLVARHPTEEDLYQQQRHGHELVYAWASDQEISDAQTKLDEAETRLEEAMAAFTEAKKNAKPLVEDVQLKAAAKVGGYLAVRPIKLAGRQYHPGEPVPAEVLDGLPWPKVNGWLTGRNPTLRKV